MTGEKSMHSSLSEHSLFRLIGKIEALAGFGVAMHSKDFWNSIHVQAVKLIGWILFICAATSAHYRIKK